MEKHNIKRRNVLDRFFDHYKDIVTDVEVTVCFWQTRFRVDPGEPIQLQRMSPFSFSRKCLLTRAYKNGLIAELNSISI